MMLDLNFVGFAGETSYIINVKINGVIVAYYERVPPDEEEIQYSRNVRFSPVMEVKANQIDRSKPLY